MSDTERDRAFWQNPKADIADFTVFALGWSAAMKFMASPRIPCLHPTDPLQRQYYVPTPTIKWSEEENEILRRAAEAKVRPNRIACLECGGTGMIEVRPPPSPETVAFIQSCMGPDPDPPRFEADPDRPGHLRRAGEEHNPHGLVAFYTDAPTCGCSLRQRSLGDGCGVCNPDLNKDAPDV